MIRLVPMGERRRVGRDAGHRAAEDAQLGDAHRRVRRVRGARRSSRRRSRSTRSMNIVRASPRSGGSRGSSGGYISGYGIGWTMSASGVASARNGAMARSPASAVAGVGHQRQHDELAVVLLGHERHRRAGHDVGDRRQLVRRGLGGGDEPGDRVRRGRQDQHPADDRRHGRGAGTGTASRRRSCRRRRGSPRTGPGASSASTRRSWPSAVTISAASSESIVRPYLRTR